MSEIYPLGLCLSNKHIIVACKSEIIVFGMLDFTLQARIPMPHIVTSMDAEGDNLAIGLINGKVLYYSIDRQRLITEISYYPANSSICRVKWVRYCRLCTVDSLGSLVFFDINIKTIMDKTVTTTADSYPIYQEKSVRTTDKLKKIWKNFMSKEENQTELQRYFHNYFTLIHNHYGEFVSSEELICATFLKNTVRIIVLNK
jgi:hypothetical protein